MKKAKLYIRICLLIIIVLVGLCLFSQYRLVKLEKENLELTDTVNDYKKNSDENVKKTVRKYMEEGKGTTAMLRYVYDDCAVIFDTYKYIFVDVDESLRLNTLNTNNFIRENGEVRYEVDSKTVSHKGIDVSKFQGDIDWAAVADSGVEFAMIRLGYRGYGTGEIALDEKALTNIQGATDAGIKVGVYFFSQAITEDEAVEEAEFVLDIIKDYDVEYPVVFDTEEIYNDDGRAEDLSPEDLTKITSKFCSTIKKAGYTPMIYANLRWYLLSLDMAELDKYDKWYASYENTLYFPYEIGMWQYSEEGEVNGITGDVDLNISFKDYSTED